MDSSSINIAPKNNNSKWNKITDHMKTITDNVKTSSTETWYKVGLLVYCIFIIILFTRNPYDIITGNNKGLGIFLSLLGGFLLLMMYLFYADKKQSTENVKQLSALSYFGRILSLLGLICVISGVVYLLVKIAYYFSNASYAMTYILNWLIFIGLITMITKYLKLDQIPGGKSSPSWFRLLIQIITYIPCLVLSFVDYIKYQYEITTNVNARYVKLLGFGRFNSTGDTRTSVWTAIGEIEFYGSERLSVGEVDLQNSIALYPVPAKNKLYIKNINNHVVVIRIYSLDGRKIIEKTLNTSSVELSIDTSSLDNGAYIVNFSNSNQAISKMIIISN